MGRLRRNKYNAVGTWYEHRRYDSKAEAARAMLLNMLVNCGDIDRWMPQPRFFLGEAKIEYVPDFIVYQDTRIWCEDVKGYQTRVFKIKKALWGARGGGPCPLHLIALKGKAWSLFETIPGGGQE